MLDDWSERRIARLEQDLASLRNEVRGFDAQIDRRLRERDREGEWRDRARAGRRLELMSWAFTCLIWAAVGATIAVAAIQAG
jgi:hypothetical protein